MSLASGGIGGPGSNLPSPVALYPPGLNNVANLPASNKITLAPGETLLVPRGQFNIGTDSYSQVQWLNPVTTVWENISSARIPITQVISDGNNYRVANVTSCPVLAVVTNGGTSGYNQATTTVTASGSGGSQWLPIIGGQLGTAVTITASGSGYGLPPLVFCAAPPAPGVAATWTAAIANGTVSSVTCINQGANYQTNQTLSFVPDPSDPNLPTLPVAASAIATLVTASGTATSGKLTAVLCVNPGQAVTAAPTLTVTGASTGATATALVLWTATGLTVTNGSTVSATNLVISQGGQPTVTTVWTNPSVEGTGYIPRMAQMNAAVASGTLTLGTTVAAIYDGGMFLGTQPNPIILSSAGATGTIGLAFTFGGANATATVQPAT